MWNLNLSSSEGSSSVSTAGTQRYLWISATCCSCCRPFHSFLDGDLAEVLGRSGDLGGSSRSSSSSTTTGIGLAGKRGGSTRGTALISILFCRSNLIVLRADRYLQNNMDSRTGNTDPGTEAKHSAALLNQEQQVWRHTVWDSELNCVTVSDTAHKPKIQTSSLFHVSLSVSLEGGAYPSYHRVRGRSSLGQVASLSQG